MAENNVTAVIPSSVNNIELSDHGKDNGLNELEQLAGIKVYDD